MSRAIRWVWMTTLGVALMSPVMSHPTAPLIIAGLALAVIASSFGRNSFLAE